MCLPDVFSTHLPSYPYGYIQIGSGLFLFKKKVSHNNSCYLGELLVFVLWLLWHKVNAKLLYLDVYTTLCMCVWACKTNCSLIVVIVRPRCKQQIEILKILILKFITAIYFCFSGSTALVIYTFGRFSVFVVVVRRLIKTVDKNHLFIIIAKCYTS